MGSDELQIVAVAAQVLTAGGTGGVLYMLGGLVSTVKAHGERLEKLEQGHGRPERNKHGLAFVAPQ